MENRLRYGSTIYDGYVFTYHDNWRDMMASWLIPAIAGLRAGTVITEPLPRTSDDDIVFVAALIFKYLRSGNLEFGSHEAILNLLFAMPRVFALDEDVLAATVIFNPNLLETFPLV